MVQGINVKKLIAQKMATDAIPSGGGLVAGINFLRDKDRIVAGAKKATAFVEAAIRAVREAAAPNPWKNADDETIAGEILRQIAEKKSI